MINIQNLICLLNTTDFQALWRHPPATVLLTVHFTAVAASLLYLDILAVYELQLDFWAHGQASLTAPP